MLSCPRPPLQLHRAFCDHPPERKQRPLRLLSSDSARRCPWSPGSPCPCDRPAVNRREGPGLPKEAEPGVTHKGTDRRFHTGRAGLSHTHARAHTHRKPTPHSCAEGRLGFQERTHPPRVPEPLPLHCRSCPGPAVQAQGHGGHGIKVRGCGLVGPECAESWTGREGGRGATHPLAGEAEGRVPGLGGGGSGLLGRAPSSAVVPAQPEPSANARGDGPSSATRTAPLFRGCGPHLLSPQEEEG